VEVADVARAGPVEGDSDTAAWTKEWKRKGGTMLPSVSVLLGEVAGEMKRLEPGSVAALSAHCLLVGLSFQFFGIRLGVQRVEGGQARIFDRPVGEVDGV
jgi:hypothetical protein